MHSMRNHSVRWILVALLLPGYLLLLSAGKETDGGFAYWLDLTLDTSLGKSINTGSESSKNTLLIGEWKQFRQVNTSTTPVEQPELRDAKHTLRLGFIPVFDIMPSTGKPNAPYLNGSGIDDPAVLSTAHHSEPMESGLAIGAP